ncbi:hypothetical protein ABN763_05820 [Spongiivirga sp. MCCC 1A20706]|uniref:hypothetical protein n=1 Tax=Spongiivirga sp. MCCC 1A20706 TaxID=3160963 RepID=UPI00397767F2
MKKYISILFILVAAASCIVKYNADEEGIKDQINLIGEWDNFQQYWLENTAEDMHRVETDDKHRHLSLIIDSLNNDQLNIEVREGRNGKNLIEKMAIPSNKLPDHFKLINDTLYISGKAPFENKDAYKFIRTRKFSGWVEAPKSNGEEDTYRNDNLVISDQGGMAELQVDGSFYTVELTQLLFAKKLAIMKLAVYDMPMDSVEINSRSISYTWTNPAAKRLGINLRKVLSGWTFIEPGYQNQNSWQKEKE